ncbi:MAG TPA: T9SS type A sorting domain-containing protein, partial [Bacteroidetes bacterium]|nr:T9SS type A sorting domain-containing protein [Bacteroidota bacterium]
LMTVTMFTVNAQLPCLCDDPNAIVVGATGGGTNLSDAITAGLLEDMPNAITTPQNVCILGRLNIDIPTYNFTTSFLNMGPGAIIRIPFGKSLTIGNSTIYGCTDMWDGISIEPGGSLDITSSTVMDADAAIAASFATKLIAQNNTFENNRIGIQATSPSAGFFSGVSLPLPLTGNTFTTNGSLLSGGLGFAGIELFNQFGFTVGTTNGAASPNVFDNLENGIIAHSSTFGVHGANFGNMPIFGFPFPVSNPRGYGIIADNRCRANITDCTFTALTVGIHGTDSSLDVFDNSFNPTSLQEFSVTLGIRAVGSNSKPRIDIHDNNINALRWGMLFIGVGDARLFDIVANDIEVGDTDIDPIFTGFGGIVVNDGGFSSATRGLIDNNTIDVNGARIGIDILECSNINIVGNDIAIQPIASTAVQNGISIDGSRSLYVQGNTVSSSPLLVSTRGMTVNRTTSSTYCCNIINGAQTGVEFNGTCSGSFFRGTTFGDANIGLLYQPDAITGQQFIANNRWTGSFGDVAARHSGNQQTMDLSRYRVNPFSPPTLPPSINAPSQWFFSTSLSTLFNCPSATCGDAIELPPDSSDTLSGEVPIAKGTWDSGLPYHGTLAWQAERYLLSRLDRFPDAVQNDPIFNSFYYAKQGTTLDFFNGIYDDIASLEILAPTETTQYEANQTALFSYLYDLSVIDSQLYDATGTQTATLQTQRDTLLEDIRSLEEANDALLATILAARAAVIPQVTTDNNAIVTRQVYEQNEKEVNDIWLNTVAQGIYTLTPAQTTTLEGIIYQCPNYGGNAVFKARAIYSLENDVEYDDGQLCGEVAGRASNDLTTDAKPKAFKLYPNPANDRLNIVLGEMEDTGATLQVADVTGKTVRQYELPSEQSRYSFDTSDLAEGIYFIKIMQGKKQLFVRTFVISR